MNHTLYYVLIAFVISWSIGRYFIPRIILISKKRRLFDELSDRKVHTTQTSRMGGVSFFPAILISFCITTATMLNINPEIVLYLKQDYTKDMLFMFSGLILIFSMGMMDDIGGVSYKHKFLIQIIAALIIVIPLHHIESLHGIFGIYKTPLMVSIPLAATIVVLIINAYNLIDGIDGLCSGLTVLSVTTLGVMFTIADLTIMPILASCTVGALTIFFVYNVFGVRMKIFMGDSGSLMMGYLVAYLALQYVSIPATSAMLHNQAAVFAIAFGAVFIPVFDTLRVFSTRLAKGQSPFIADRSHIHHKFLDLGFSHIRTTFIIITIQATVIIANAIMTKILDANIIITLDILFGIGLNATLNFHSRRANKASKTAKQIIITTAKQQ